MNKVILIGRLGRDPELRYTQSGKAVANFTLATSEGPRDNEKTEWHRIVVWDKTAEMVGRYLNKGRQVAIDGRIQTREWEDKDGNQRKSTEIVANRVEFIGSRGDGETSAPAASRPMVPPPEAAPYADDDDIPF